MTNPNPNPQPSAWQRWRQKRIFRWGIDILVLIVVFGAITAFQSRNLVQKGTQAPHFELVDTTGKTHHLADDYHGKKVVLVFWATWCGVCKAESDNLSRLQKWVGDRVTVLSVVLDSEPAAIERFMADNDVQYPVLIGNRHISQDYNVSSYPTMYILNADGTIRRHDVGYSTTLGMLWRALF